MGGISFRGRASTKTEQQQVSFVRKDKSVLNSKAPADHQPTRQHENGTAASKLCPQGQKRATLESTRRPPTYAPARKQNSSK
ncbi:hypothetical protein ACFFSY_28920 [Paenibacillus aurantiacus]|uniref:Uncharacterized protein n=1 Tax=Paenibacillus aurantiacus TaxID=1936118 RepID=A0ABV5KZY1_9BACL